MSRSMETAVIRGSVAAIVPETQVDLRKWISIGGPCVVSGPVLVGHVRIDEGPVTLEQSLYALSDVNIEPANGDVCIAGPIGAGQTVVVRAASQVKKVYVGADITAPTIRLTDCVVLGSVLGQTVTLERCAVIGTVEAQRRLTMTETYAGSVAAHTLEASGSILLGTGTGVFETRPDLRAATVRCSLLVDYQAQNDAEASSLVAIGESDCREVVVRVARETRKRWMLSLAPRVLNGARARAVVAKNTELLRRLARATHWHSEERANEPARFETVGDFLLRLTRGAAGPANGRA